MKYEENDEFGLCFEIHHSFLKFLLLVQKNII